MPAWLGLVPSSFVSVRVPDTSAAHVLVERAVQSSRKIQQRECEGTRHHPQRGCGGGGAVCAPEGDAEVGREVGIAGWGGPECEGEGVRD
jgi:hypothetical protein